MRNYSTYILSTLFFYLAIFPNSWEKRKSALSSYTGEKTFLLSYPRSGNTFLRYCLEFLTLRPTFYRFCLRGFAMNLPIADSIGFVINDLLKPIEKVHFVSEIERINGNPLSDYLILLVRDPLENLIREIGCDRFIECVEKNIVCNDFNQYFKNLILFWAWSQNNKILIYYEDFICKPKETLQKILTFLGEDDQRLDDFMVHFEEHKKKALLLYRFSQSGGEDLHYHSRKLTVSQRKKAKEFLRTKYAIAWHLFLRRYDDPSGLNELE